MYSAPVLPVQKLLFKLDFEEKNRKKGSCSLAGHFCLFFTINARYKNVEKNIETLKA